MKQYNVLYKGRKIYKNLSAEDCVEVIQDLSEKLYSDKDFDPTLIELEEIYGT